jgi:hypothetical protein
MKSSLPYITFKLDRWTCKKEHYIGVLTKCQGLYFWVLQNARIALNLPLFAATLEAYAVFVVEATVIATAWNNYK